MFLVQQYLDDALVAGADLPHFVGDPPGGMIRKPGGQTLGQRRGAVHDLPLVGSQWSSQ